MLLSAHHQCAMSPQCVSKGHHFFIWPLEGLCREVMNVVAFTVKPALNASSDAVGGLEEGLACLCWKPTSKAFVFKLWMSNIIAFSHLDVQILNLLSPKDLCCVASTCRYFYRAIFDGPFAERIW